MNFNVEEGDGSLVIKNDENSFLPSQDESIAYVFQNTIRVQRNGSFECDQSGDTHYLVNNDTQNRYWVTVVSTWTNNLTGALESYTKIYTAEIGSEIFLGCDYQYLSGNGNTRIARKITHEVKILD